MPATAVMECMPRQLPAVPSHTQGDSQMVAGTVPWGQPGGASCALPTGPLGQPLRAHSGCFGVFPMAPSPITLLPVHAHPALFSYSLPVGLSPSLWPELALSRSLDLFCFVPLLGLSSGELPVKPPGPSGRDLHSPRPWAPLSQQDPQLEHLQSAALLLSPTGKAAQGPSRGAGSPPPPWCILPG